MKFLVITSHGKRLSKKNRSIFLLPHLETYTRDITVARGWLSALDYAAVESYSAMWIEWKVIKESYEKFHRRLYRRQPHTPMIIITDDICIDSQLCFQNELLFSVVKQKDIVANIPDIIKRLESYHKLLTDIPPEVRNSVRPNGFGPFIGNSLPMLEIYRQIAKVAATDFTVLILGGSGSGKELVARTIHENSKRKDRPFISVNCAAIPENLLESELFGYEKGAFTGANQAKPGKFELADKGTLFLDEIGDMALPLQAKLLRVLEDHVVERLGSVGGRRIDIRLLAATHQDLPALVKEGKFRSDLHYRMNVIPLQLTSLANRQNDILLLSLHILRDLLTNQTEKIKGISWGLVDKLKTMAIAGNVRELENLLTRIVFYSNGNILTPDILNVAKTDSSISNEKILPEGKDGLLPLWKLEREAILNALDLLNGNISKVAAVLEISRVTLYRKMKKYQIHQAGIDFETDEQDDSANN